MRVAPRSGDSEEHSHRLLFPETYRGSLEVVKIGLQVNFIVFEEGVEDFLESCRPTDSVVDAEAAGWKLAGFSQQDSKLTQEEVGGGVWCKASGCSLSCLHLVSPIVKDRPSDSLTG